MQLHNLEEILADINNQPDWRRQADNSSEHYGGKQLTAQGEPEMEESKEPPTVVQPGGRAINGLSGHQAKTRLDWKSACDSDAFQEVVT